MIIGLVGAPNTGKSTFFKAATLAEVEIANYPFVTIKLNCGVAYVKIDCVDKEFNVKCDPREGFCLDSKRFVPVQLIDVAGLVPGAHEGKGMGNQFLSDLNQANVLIHVVDISGSTNEKGEPVEPGSYNPSEDVKFLEVELDMWYLEILKRGWEKFARTLEHEKENIPKAIAKQLSGLRVTEDMVKEVLKNLEGNPSQWNDEQILFLAKELRKRSKPMIIAANKIDIKGAEENFERLKKEFPDYEFIPCFSEGELALREAAKKDLIKYIPGENHFEVKEKLSEVQEKGLKLIEEGVLKKFGSTGVQDILNKAVFKILNYIAVFPVSNSKLEDKDGRKLPNCHLLRKGSSALDLAFNVHQDLGKNFIKAMDLKTKKVIGKDSVLKDGDVIEIMVKK